MHSVPRDVTLPSLDKTQLRKRCAPHRIASAGFFGQNRKLKRSWKTDLGVERSRNPDLVGRIPTSGRRRLGRLEAPMPGRFAETVGLDDSFEKKILGRIPTLGSAGLRCRAGAAGRPCRAGMWRARRWASPYSLGKPSNEVGRARTHWANPYWASQYSLGEPVLIGRTRIGRAIKRGWGEPSNEVGRASTKGPLGKPLNFHSGLHACFKAAPAWRGA